MQQRTTILHYALTITECRITSFYYAAGIIKYLKMLQKYMFGRRSEPQLSEGEKYLD